LELSFPSVTFAANLKNFYHNELFIIVIIQNQNTTKMADHIENEGKKGYCMMWFFLFLLFFASVLIYVYRYNFNLTF